MMEAARIINRLIRREADIIGSENVILAGYSQGAALALLVAITSPRPLGEMVLLGPWLPIKYKLEDVRTVYYWRIWS